MAATIDRAAIDRVIRRHLAQLRKPGVLTVRPGFELAGGRFTDRTAIVVTVDRKRARLPAGERLPETIDGIPVDVREATATQRLRRAAPAKHTLVVTHGPHELRDRAFPYERRVRDGKLVTPPKAAPPVSAKSQLAYTPPAGKPLRSATRRMTIVACASPDAGFTVLAGFLAEVRRSLTIGLYDFTSAGILAAFDKSMGTGGKELCLVLDHPAPNPTANQSDEQTVAAIRKANPKARQAWALTRPDPFAAKWIFPMAYHIKVAVRDSSSFWLSSGNWNVSNQPDFAANDPAAGALDTADRDWHVVVMDEGLARLYEAYIRHDFQVASAAQAKPAAGARTAVSKALAAHAALRRPASASDKAAPAAAHMAASKPSTTSPPFTLGKPRSFTNVAVTVQPVLTPDRGKRTTMYVDHVLALLQSARKRIYLQTQYISAPTRGPAPADFMCLVDALGDAVRRRLDVRLIMSQYENVPNDVEFLHAAGLSGVMRIQQRVHNKGIVVDSRAVLVSSQNWSAEGVLQNRDAGLIIHNAAIAQYFEAIFLQDWEERATTRIASAPVAPIAHPSTSPKRRKATSR